MFRANQRAWVAMGVAALALGFTSSAFAEPATHDGFYFRGGLGPNFATISAEASMGNQSQDSSLSGAGLGIELLFGGTIAEGLVLGGALLADSMIDPTYEYDGEEQELDGLHVQLNTLAVFSSYYPDPTAGFYVGGLVGYGGITFKFEDEDSQDTDLDGLVLGAHAGYDFWVSDEWSLGPELRLMLGLLSNEEDGVEYDDTYAGGALSLTLTYH